MSEQSSNRIPTEVSLHRKSRLLVVEFADGKRFELPCEYLRVFSRAKEVRSMEGPITGKEEVNITRIEPQGQYALQLVFDDGHDTGIYSWETLYELGEKREENWQGYLKQLQAIGYVRGAESNPDEKRRVKLLYFTFLVQKMRREAEEVDLPPSVTDVASLLEWIQRRNRDAAHLFQDGRVRVTVNKQFAELFTRIENGDEVAFVPTSPVAPAAG